MFKYVFVVQGQDVFEREFSITAKSFDEAFEEAKDILKKMAGQTIEQISIVSIEVKRV